MPNDALATAIIFNFPFKFVDSNEVDQQPFYRPRDNSLKTDFCARRDVIEAFTWLVIDTYTDGPVIPSAKISASTKEFLIESGVDKMSKYIVRTDVRTDHVTLKDLKLLCQSRGIDYKQALMRIERMGIKQNKICIGGDVKGRGFYGVKTIDDDVDDDVI